MGGRWLGLGGDGRRELCGEREENEGRERGGEKIGQGR